MNAKTYGYIRVSTKEQNEARQVDAMREFGIPGSRIYMDKLSGKTFNRPNYKRLLAKLRPGDILVVKSIDRLGRNYDDIQAQWRYLTRDRQVDIVVLDMPLLDTRKKDQDLTGVFIADLVLQILSYVAQIERENIRQRQAEGIASAKARGVHFGNPGIPLPEDFAEVAARWRNKEIPLTEALNILGIGRSYFYKHVKELGI